MKFKIIDSPSNALFEEIKDRIREFNVEHWDVKQKKPLVVVLEDGHEKMLAGASARTFGDWLLIENIWVSASLRGQHVGTGLLQQLEASAIARGCKFALLDTLEFQARPFYEKFGYEVRWVQEGYPKTGCKYFMVKNLGN